MPKSQSREAYEQTAEFLLEIDWNWHQKKNETRQKTLQPAIWRASFRCSCTVCPASLSESDLESDMPQPLSSINPSYSAQWASGALLKYPDLSAMAMEVIAIWSHIDMKVASIISNFMALDLMAATIMNQAIHETARLAALTAVAKESLSPDDHRLFDIALASTDKSSQRRNHFAHHIWGTCEQIPDALVLAPPQQLNRDKAKYYQAAITKLPVRLGPHGYPWDSTKWKVYKKPDLQDSVKGAERALDIVMKLELFTNPRILQSTRDSKRQELLSDPTIQHRFQKRSDQEKEATERSLTSTALSSSE